MQIEKELLLLDERYQRTQSAVKVAVMASKWSWQACGCILVAHRKVPSAVKFYVFDGGHRVAAAKKLAEITTLPCLVFEAMCCGLIERDAVLRIIDAHSAPDKGGDADAGGSEATRRNVIAPPVGAAGGDDIEEARRRLADICFTARKLEYRSAACC